MSTCNGKSFRAIHPALLAAAAAHGLLFTAQADADEPTMRHAPAVTHKPQSRNCRCACGSGKKFKRCCGA